MTASLRDLSTYWDRFVDLVIDGIRMFASMRRARGVLTFVERDRSVFAIEADPETSNLLTGTIRFDPTGILSGDGPQVIEAARHGRLRLMLQKERFLYREIVLPQQAAEFIPSILRTEIDRLTPWSSDNAIFGHYLIDTSDQKITLGVLAADQRLLQPVFDGLLALHPRALTASVRVSVRGRDLDVPVFEAAELRARSRTMRVALTVFPLLLATALGLATIYEMWRGWQVDTDLEATQSQLVLERAGGKSVDPATAAQRWIIDRKRQGPAATLLIEDLSRVIPDDTFLTDIDLNGAKIRLSGLSRDATALVGLVESSGSLTDVTFFAPTTRDAIEPGEKFHIEATIKPRIAK